MTELATLIKAFGKTTLDYGVFAAGWLMWLLERKRYNSLVELVVSYFTKINMLGVHDDENGKRD